MNEPRAALEPSGDGIAGVRKQRMTGHIRRVVACEERDDRRHFLGGTDYDNWPLEPIELVNNVPFLITVGYSLKGKAELAEDYLKYCIQHCTWNNAPFMPDAGKAMKKALDTLLASPKWKVPLDDGEKQFLSSQIELRENGRAMA